jgi:hypothetical protein
MRYAPIVLHFECGHLNEDELVTMCTCHFCMEKRVEFCTPIHVLMMNVAYSISKFYTIYPSLYVGYFCKNVCAKLLRLAFYKKRRSTMTFGRGQLPYRKRAGPARAKAKSKTARKKARFHVSTSSFANGTPSGFALAKNL